MGFVRHEIRIGTSRAAYWEKNPHNLDTLIFLHGFPGNHRGLLDLAHTFSDHRIILPDLPGSGESEPFKTRHTLFRFSMWLHEFLKTLHIHRATIIGHSFGSRVAIEFSAYHPHQVRNLVLITPVILLNGALDRSAYYISEITPRSLRTRIMMSSLYQRFISSLIFKSASMKRQAHLNKENDREMRHLNEKATNDISDEFLGRNLLHLAPDIPIPTLVIAGSQDEVAPLETIQQFARLLSHGHLEIVPGAGHIVPLEKPKTVGTLIRRWLELQKTEERETRQQSAL